jgi:CDP-diacylglycerol--serine O-phosphatidyltransferase
MVALVVARPAASPELTVGAFSQLALGLTVLLSLLMVSTVPFRSFKDLRLNTSTILLVSFAVGSSVYVWRNYSVDLVLVWLLSVYVTIGMLEAIRVLAGRARTSKKSPAVQPKS